MVLLMFLARVWTFSFVLLLSTSCSLSSKNGEQEVKLLEPVVRNYNFEYDKVWRAIQKTLSRYPIRVNNVDTGRIETDEVKGLKVWSPAHKPKIRQPGLRYSLSVLLIRGQGPDGGAATEVSIEKKLRIEKNFFAESKRLASDGLEEESLHYRIQRELTLEKALDTAYEREQ